MISLALLFCFVVLPILELALLLKVGETLHLGGTLALVLLTGVVGAGLTRWQGLRTLGLMQQDMAQGRMPAPYLIDGVLILLAGAVLMTPGLITDTFGFVLLVPFTRSIIKRWLRAKIEEKVRQGTIDVVHWEQKG